MRFYAVPLVPFAAGDLSRRDLPGIDASMDQQAELEMAKNGGAAARTDLLRDYADYHGDLVRFLALRLRCLFTARDLAQEVYLRALRVENADQIQNPRALLFRIASNLATDHRRVESRRMALLREAHDLLWSEADEISPDREVLAKDELRRIEAALLSLPERTRMIFYLNRFDGVTQREIAERLGIARTTVEKHMRRAVERVGQTLIDDQTGTGAAGGGKIPARSS